MITTPLMAIYSVRWHSYSSHAMKHAVSKVFTPDFVIIPLITMTDRIIFILRRLLPPSSSDRSLPEDDGNHLLTQRSLLL
jgi:hypothetical protein